MWTECQRLTPYFQEVVQSSNFSEDGSLGRRDSRELGGPVFCDKWSPQDSLCPNVSICEWAFFLEMEWRRAELMSPPCPGSGEWRGWSPLPPHPCSAIGTMLTQLRLWAGTPGLPGFWEGLLIGLCACYKPMASHDFLIEIIPYSQCSNFWINFNTQMGVALFPWMEDRASSHSCGTRSPSDILIPTCWEGLGFRVPGETTECQHLCIF